MNLAEWATLSDAERRRVVVEWHHNWRELEWDLGDVSRAAAQALERELEAIPEVTHVAVGVGEIVECPASPLRVSMPVLCVCTTLHGSQQLENLPSGFSGFQVRQDNFGDKRDAFLATLICCLREFKGFDENQALEWIKHWGDRLSPGPNLLIDALEGGVLATAVYSHGPVEKAIGALLDQQTTEKVEAAGNHRIYLRNHLLRVIAEAVRKAGSTEFHHPDRIVNFDWEAVRKEIRQVIDDYSTLKRQN